MSFSHNLHLILRDSHNPSNNTKVEIMHNQLTLSLLIKIGSKELNIKNASKIYYDNGDEVLSLSSIKNNDQLFVSNEEKLLDINDEVYTICMLGAGAVGKSALTLQFVQGQFVSDYDPTIEDAYRKHIELDGNSIMLDVLDTAGQGDFIALRTSWMRNKDGFVLVFSIIERKSYEDLFEFYEQLCEVYENDIPPLVLVGNKVDLCTGQLRQVSYKEAADLAVKWGAIQYIETSAKTGVNIRSMFGGLLREIVSIGFKEQLEYYNSKKNVWKDFCMIL